MAVVNESVQQKEPVKRSSVVKIRKKHTAISVKARLLKTFVCDSSATTLFLFLKICNKVHLSGYQGTGNQDVLWKKIS